MTSNFLFYSCVFMQLSLCILHIPVKFWTHFFGMMDISKGAVESRRVFTILSVPTKYNLVQDVASFHTGVIAICGGALFYSFLPSQYLPLFFPHL